MKKSLKEFEVKELTKIEVVKGGSNGKGTKKSTAYQQNNALDLL